MVIYRVYFFRGKLLSGLVLFSVTSNDVSGLLPGLSGYEVMGVGRNGIKEGAFDGRGPALAYVPAM